MQCSALPRSRCGAADWGRHHRRTSRKKARAGKASMTLRSNVERVCELRLPVPSAPDVRFPGRGWHQANRAFHVWTWRRPLWAAQRNAIEAGGYKPGRCTRSLTAPADVHSRAIRHGSKPARSVYLGDGGNGRSEHGRDACATDRGPALNSCKESADLQS